MQSSEEHVMKWEGREESQNVEDRRGMGKKAGIAIGGGSIIVVILALILGVDPRKLMGPGGMGGNQGGQQAGPKQPPDPAEERMAKFTSVIFNDTEVIWTDLFKQMGETYEKPTLVLYTDEVDSGCGSASSSVGPFYCPRDQKVYIDLSFYKELEKNLGAPGEFARAYVIAHEVGHHVQRLLGYSARVDEARGTALENQMSVRLELQADYLAGVWAHHGHQKWKFLETGDVEAGIKAAWEIGDDRLQRRAGRVVTPHTFTHGTSAQRTRWFKRGLETGNVRAASQLFDLRYDEL
jgi:predicted metalloprotease